MTIRQTQRTEFDSFVYQAEGTLVHIIRAYTALYLGVTPSHRTGTSPPICLLLDNRLYMSPDRKTKIVFQVVRMFSR